MKHFDNIEAYISAQEPTVQNVLRTVKSAIEEAAPEAISGISYGMPAYKFKGKPLAYFAANKKHLGFYPTSSPISFFKTELAEYATSKGAVQFPYNEKLPINLMKKMIKFRANKIAVSKKNNNEHL